MSLEIVQRLGEAMPCITIVDSSYQLIPIDTIVTSTDMLTMILECIVVNAK